MTTAVERKARREERLLKEEKRRYILMILWTGLKYIGAVAGMVAATWWLAVVMWEYKDWALNVSWGLASLAIGTFLLYKAGERR